MTLRGRLTVVVALAAALAVGATSVVAALLIGWQMRRQVDDSLRARAEQVLGGQPADRPVEFVPTAPGSVEGLGFFQDLVTAEGTSQGSAAPLPDAAAEVASGGARETFFDAELDGLPLRFYARQVQPGLALVLGRRVDDVERALSALRLVGAGVGAAGLALAAALAWTLADTALRPMSRLTAAVEVAAATRDLAHRVPLERDDELGRLARSVNELLTALADAQRSRQQLIADASHELRSPLASLRTNVEVLAEVDRLPEPERAALRRDVLAQTAELTTLVEDLVALARDRPPEAQRARLQLDEVVQGAVERIRARARARQVRIDTDLAPCPLRGVAADLERAVANLLDNAVKWSPAGAGVHVRVTPSGELTVRDHGPGIPAEDRPYVFDRFYRSREARTLPGSGLGLAIVRKVVDEHGGTIAAEAAPGGGTTMHVRLPADREDAAAARP